MGLSALGFHQAPFLVWVRKKSRLYVETLPPLSGPALREMRWEPGRGGISGHQNSWAEFNTLPTVNSGKSGRSTDYYFEGVPP